MSKKQFIYKGFKGTHIPGFDQHGDAIRIDKYIDGIRVHEAVISLHDVNSQDDFDIALMKLKILKNDLAKLKSADELTLAKYVELVPSSRFAEESINVKSKRKTFKSVANEYLKEQLGKKETGEISKSFFDYMTKQLNSARFKDPDPDCPVEAIEKAGFNQLTLNQINVKLVREYRQYLQRGVVQANGTKGYSQKTVKNIYSLIAQVLDFAVENEYMESNPTDKLSKLKSEKSGRPIREDEFFKPAEQVAIFEAARNDNKEFLGLMFLFACWTGLRKEEVLAMSYENVDLEKREMRVTRKFTAKAWGDPKTELSNRQIKLNDQAVKIFLRAKQLTGDLDPITVNVMRTRKGGEVEETFSPVFRNFSKRNQYLPVEVSTWKETSLRKAWTRVRDLADVHKEFSGGRHTYTTYMLSTGATPFEVAVELGHTGDMMVKKSYGELTSHFTKDKCKILADLIDSL